MFISGPVSLNVFYSKADKHYVYVFGDIHESLTHLCKPKYNAPVIWDFLFNIITLNPTIFFNLLIEAHIHNNSNYNLIYDNVDPISKIIDKFNSNKTNQMQFSNAMIHYVDYRITNAYSNIITKFNKKYKESHHFFYKIEEIDQCLVRLLLIYYNTPNGKLDYKSIHKYLILISTLLTTLEHDMHINTVFDYVNTCDAYINYSKIDKQYIHIKNNLYVDILRKYTSNFFKFILKKYKNINLKDIIETFKCAARTKNTPTETQDILDNKISKIYEFYEFNLELQSILMDTYAMGRLLRHFKEYDDIRFKDKKKYSIFYVGQKHCTTYNKLLTEMKFDLLYKSNGYSDNKRCIEIKKEAFNNLTL